MAKQTHEILTDCLNNTTR